LGKTSTSPTPPTTVTSSSSATTSTSTRTTPSTTTGVTSSTLTTATSSARTTSSATRTATTSSATRTATTSTPTRATLCLPEEDSLSPKENLSRRKKFQNSDPTSVSDHQTSTISGSVHQNPEVNEHCDCATVKRLSIVHYFYDNMFLLSAWHFCLLKHPIELIVTKGSVKLTLQFHFECLY